VPLQWARTQNNLGNALTVLGERESGTARLEEAVAAYHEALKERTRERVPLQWAQTQNNLGNALRVLGERESGTARLDEARIAIESASEVYRHIGMHQYEAYCEASLRSLRQIIAQRYSCSEEPTGSSK
jgi:tetratricopeptide (TPR) repeat protein